MKALKIIALPILILVLVGYLGFIGYTFYFHWVNPHYTEMMLFQKFWLHYLIGTAALIIALELFNKTEK